MNNTENNSAFEFCVNNLYFAKTTWISDFKKIAREIFEDYNLELCVQGDIGADTAERAHKILIPLNDFEEFVKRPNPTTHSVHSGCFLRYVRCLGSSNLQKFSETFQEIVERFISNECSSRPMWTIFEMPKLPSILAAKTPKDETFLDLLYNNTNTFTKSSQVKSKDILEILSYTFFTKATFEHVNMNNSTVISKNTTKDFRGLKLYSPMKTLSFDIPSVQDTNCDFVDFCNQYDLAREN